MKYIIEFYETQDGVADVWELRPGNNRIFYFCSCDNTFILLHSFRKKTQKTPRREIEKALRERNDYLKRKELPHHENMD
jgi:phage-related protein